MLVRAVVAVVVVIVAVIILAVVVYPAVYAQISTPPPQPIAFNHVIHVKVAQLDCLFCHRTAEISDTASVPAVQQCMFCHQVVRTERPEIQKLANSYQNNEPINWERVYRVPDHVRFAHEPHLRAQLDCATCHGQVQEMPVVRQVRPLNMPDCVDCHRQNNAPTECTTCHY
ncbi:MAG: cytochrome c3 family protein [Chloroflexi bacterium]|nr:cytochrome c3 family protein [Chloroflexota bacterium]